MIVHWHLTFLQQGQVCSLWEKCSEFQTTSPLEPLGQWCSNFIWSLLGAGKWKIAKMVAVHWPRWPPCPYMVKTFKNLLLQNRGGLVAESLRISLGTGSLPKLQNNDHTLTFDLFTARSGLLPYAFEFQMTSPLEPLSQWCSNFIWSLPRAGEWKIHGCRPLTKMAAMYIYGKKQNQGCLMVESLHKLSGTGDLPK